MKETLRRAGRTFLQAAVGYIVANVAGAGTDAMSLKSGVMGLIAAAVACGIAAVMNLPAKSQTETENDSESEEE